MLTLFVSKLSVLQEGLRIYFGHDAVVCSFALDTVATAF